MQDNLIAEIQRQNEAQTQAEYLASLQYADKPYILKRVALDTAVALNAAEEFNIPFKSIVVMDASDDDATVKIQLTRKNPYEQALTLQKGGYFQDSKLYPSAWISGDAQTGAWILLAFFLNARYESGSRSTVVSGSVSLVSSSALTAGKATSVARVDTLLIAANTSREEIEIYNDTGGYLYILGAAGTNDQRGIYIASNTSKTIKTKAALYYYAEFALADGIKYAELS